MPFRKSATQLLKVYVYVRIPSKKATYLRCLAWGEVPRGKVDESIRTKGKRRCRVWMKDIVKHFWYCVETSDSHKQFVSKWKGVLNHITGKNRWVFGKDGKNTCKHGHISPTDEKAFSVPEYPPRQAIKRVIKVKTGVPKCTLSCSEE